MVARIINEYVEPSSAQNDVGVDFGLSRNSFHAWASDFYGHNDMDGLEMQAHSWATGCLLMLYQWKRRADL